MSSFGSEIGEVAFAAAIDLLRARHLEHLLELLDRHLGQAPLARISPPFLRRGDDRRRRGDQLDLPRALGEDAVDELPDRDAALTMRASSSPAIVFWSTRSPAYATAPRTTTAAAPAKNTRRPRSDCAERSSPRDGESVRIVVLGRGFIGR